MLLLLSSSSVNQDLVFIRLASSQRNSYRRDSIDLRVLIQSQHIGRYHVLCIHVSCVLYHVGTQQAVSIMYVGTDKTAGSIALPDTTFGFPMGKNYTIVIKLSGEREKRKKVTPLHYVLCVFAHICMYAPFVSQHRKGP